jgi:hypothetical protein
MRVMTLENAVWLLLVSAIVLANVPWILSQRLFLFIPLHSAKSILTGLIEWFSYFVLLGLMAWGLEQATMGNRSSQEWEFYVINLFLFAIFAFPGFIYRYNLKFYLDKAQKQRQ